MLALNMWTPKLKIQCYLQSARRILRSNKIGTRLCPENCIKLKTEMNKNLNREIYYVKRLEDSILKRCQRSPNFMYV